MIYVILAQKSTLHVMEFQDFVTVYVVKPDYQTHLIQELNANTDYQIFGDLIVSKTSKKNVCFAQDIWFEAEILPINSISDAVKILRQSGKYWYLYPHSHIRRSRLIEAQLRKIPTIERDFPIHEKLPEMGCFTLLDKNTLLKSNRRLKKWPLGQCFFREDKINPPNRAYLKLWEALSLLPSYPNHLNTAIDLGASPGGWTWVMHSLGTEITSIDKAPLAKHIAALERVHYLQQSAFAYDPLLSPTFDLVLSDIACYPQRALELIHRWLESKNAKQLIFTIKLQGDIDLELLEEFKKIPNSCLTQLYYNKHEVTFFYPSPYANANQRKYQS